MALIAVREERRFAPAEIELARGLGEQAAAAIHNAQHVRRLGLRARESELLNEVARKATASLNVVEVARVTIDEITRLMRFDRAALLLADDDGVLSAVFASENVPAMLEGLRCRRSTPTSARSSAEKRSWCSLCPETALSRGTRRSTACARSPSWAWRAMTTLTGVLALGNAGDKASRASDRRFLEDLGTHLSLAVNNARLFENVKLMHLGNLQALSSALNAKDYYTLGHTARVAAYAVMLAESWAGRTSHRRRSKRSPTCTTSARSRSPTACCSSRARSTTRSGSSCASIR